MSPALCPTRSSSLQGTGQGVSPSELCGADPAPLHPRWLDASPSPRVRRCCCQLQASFCSLHFKGHDIMSWGEVSSPEIKCDGGTKYSGGPQDPRGDQGSLREWFGDVWGHTPWTSGRFSPRGWEQKRLCRWHTSPPSSSAVFLVPPSTLPSPWRAPSGGTQPPGCPPKRGHEPNGVTSTRLATSVSESWSWVTAGSPPCHPFLGLLEWVGGEDGGQGQLSPCILGHLMHLLHPAATRDQHPVTMCPFPPSLSVG